MDVRYINPFMKAIKNVFATMLNTEVSFGDPYIQTNQQPSNDVSGIIGLSGDAIGTVIISFPRSSALEIASAFAGVSFEEMDEDFADAIGEIANMVAGSAKKDFENINMSISIPSVIIGKGHKVKATKTMPRLVIPCTSPIGSFIVEIGMKIIKLNNQVDIQEQTEQKELVATIAE